MQWAFAAREAIPPGTLEMLVLQILSRNPPKTASVSSAPREELASSLAVSGRASAAFALTSTRPLHGFEIAELIAERSGEVFEVEEGSLYPALQRLLSQGLVRGEWGRTEENRRARYYQPTDAGYKRLAAEIERYRRISRAINLILQGEVLKAAEA